MDADRESALDEILNWMDADGYGVPIGTHERKDAARAELQALRERVGDLELIIHAEWRGERRWFRRSEDGAWMLGRESTGWDLRGEPVCPDDGTGLPLLTPEARRALKGET